MAQESHTQGSVLVVLGPMGPPGGHPRGPHPRLSFSTTPLHNISVEIMTIFCQNELEGAKKLDKDFGQFQPFLSRGAPLLDPKGSSFSLSILYRLKITTFFTRVKWIVAKF